LALGLTRATNTWDWITFLVLCSLSLTYIWWLRWWRSGQDLSRFSRALMAFVAIAIVLVVVEMGALHLAGHTDNGTHCIDTHDGRVIDAVWDLYARVQRETGGRATLLEWDAKLPRFSVLQEEVGKAAQFRRAARTAAGRAAA
jgi:hypothetical protein